MTDLTTDPPSGAEHDDEYVVIPPESSRARKVAWVLGGIGAFAALVLLVGGIWLMRQIDPAGAGEEVTISIPKGSTTSQIASLLEREGVVTNATVFRYYVRWKDAGPFRAGLYDGLRKRSAMGDVVSRLEAGPLPPKYTELPIPEGFWLQEIRARILETFPQMSAAELDVALSDIRSRYQPPSASLEGLLFPATYRVEEGDELDEQKLVRQMVSTFEQVAAELGLDQATQKLEGAAGARQLTPYEVVIVASMIEEEAKVPEDKPKIARVIYNRLAAGMPLGIDATVLYALGEHKEQLTRSELQIDSPYNTRRFPGLPPTPIASPGRESLEAALNPAEGPWLYYVLTDEEGHHYFTDDYDDFLRAQRDARARGLL
ncbi:endolytic transglycosylase MltG [Rhabdothermincola sp.]|uniref:endolytic transglycosylase MltG n=1 Tax=Rhabdothermincola sp. TaxID=2820405 RepID=UPI002FDF6E49